jgi:hypothetical protein
MNTSAIERACIDKEKTGVFTASYAINRSPAGESDLRGGLRC